MAPVERQNGVRLGDDDHPTGPYQQTLGEAIVAAHETVSAAERERARLLRLALDRGASTRAIAELLPCNHSTVWRWAGGKASAGMYDVLGRPVP